MPNHITNRVTAEAWVWKLVASANEFDFNSLIPQPYCIARQKSCYTYVKEAVAFALDFRGRTISSTPTSFTDSEFEAFMLKLRAWKETGCIDWYDWNCKNWGTKWNSYDVELMSPGVLQFDTAWDAPHPVIAKLVEVHGVKVFHEWADEDIGSNVGTARYDKAGCRTERLLADTEEGIALARELKGE